MGASDRRLSEMSHEEYTLHTLGRQIATRVAREVGCEPDDIQVTFSPHMDRLTYLASFTLSGMAALLCNEGDIARSTSGNAHINVQAIAERIWLEVRDAHPALFDPSTREEEIKKMSAAKARTMADNELADALKRLRGA